MSVFSFGGGATVGDTSGEDVAVGVGTGVMTGVAVTTGDVEGAGEACGGPTSKYVVAYELPYDSVPSNLAVILYLPSIGGVHARP